MIIQNLLKKKDDFSTQFVKLFKDENHTELFGWLNTYGASGSLKNITEHWCIVSKSDRHLYGCSYCIENQPPPVPSNYREWVKEIEEGPAFEAYIHRLADNYAYSTFDPKKYKKLCVKTGNKAFGIYNSDTKDGVRTLVMVTLQSVSVPLNQPRGEEFEQISLSTTMDASEPWFIYTEEIKLPSSLSFGEFIAAGGIPGLEFNSQQLATAFIQYEAVQTFPEAPPVNLKNDEVINETYAGNQ